MVRLGIVGSNYGRLVLTPAFRLDPRCEVVALAGRDAARTEATARELGVPAHYSDWRALIDDPAVQAVAIAVPPALQPAVAEYAFSRGKPIFVEKPMAPNLATARIMQRQAEAAAVPAMIDFEFIELPAWRRAKEMFDQGAIGTLRHVNVSWQAENYATRMRLDSWKSSRTEGGGVLGNFASHSLHCLEWFCGPIDSLSARLFGLPGAGPQSESTALLAFSFASGAGGALAISAAAYLGSGHRLEFYGEDGTLVLANTTPDYMRGFTLHHARRPDTALAIVEVAEDKRAAGQADGRVAPVSRLATRFLDLIEGRGTNYPGLPQGVRVQQLIDAARRSHDEGVLVATAAGAMT